MDVIERMERLLSRIAWRLRNKAIRELGEAEAEAMIGERTRDYMESYPDERGGE